MSVGATCNGLLCGLVGVTGGANYFEPEGAMVIGIVSGILYISLSRFI